MSRAPAKVIAVKVTHDELRSLLERTQNEFEVSGQIFNDALAPALTYAENRDREFAAFICAVLAYGRVQHIQKSVRAVLLPMGERPVHWLLNANESLIRRNLRGWSHRFNTSQDMVLLLTLLARIYKSHESLEEILNVQSDDTAFHLLEKMVEYFERNIRVVRGRALAKSSSFWFFLPRPSSGSACKRLNLFMRWMVGKSKTDLTLWKTVLTSQLLIPVDVHVHKQALSLGLTSRKQADWKTAFEITEALRRLDPLDPTRFDFALCHLGIQGHRLILS